MKKRDKAKDAYAKKCGFNIIRLSEEQINKLVSAQMQKESPWFYKELSAKTNASATIGKKPKTFNEFIEKFNIPDLNYTEKDVDEMINVMLQDYPTEKKENVAMAIMNRAPEWLKAVMKNYSDKLGKEWTIDAEVVALQSKLDTISEKWTTAFLRTLDTKLWGDAEWAIKTLFKAWFFDVYGPHWHWDDDQYDAVQMQKWQKIRDSLKQSLRKINDNSILQME